MTHKELDFDKKTYMQNWRKDNPERIKQHRKKHYLGHKKEISTKQKERYEKHKEKYLDNSKKYAQNHKEKVGKIKKKYYLKMRNKVIMKLGSVCTICGCKKRQFHIHEIHGREHSYSFLYILKHLEDFCLLCWKCHREIHYLFNLSEAERMEFFFILNKLIEGKI